ncbi:MAG: PfkB family carbohydrate kinase, partial [Alphaproteobacteria bacterium]
MSRVIVFGSINVDLVAEVARLPGPGETIKTDSYVALPGGKGANQALAAARNGAVTHMVGAVGSDGHAPTALAQLRSDGVGLAA